MLDGFEPRDIRRIGHITPSSNTVLEPVVAQLNAVAACGASHHFTRLPVRTIAHDVASDAQFTLDGMVAAARLLAEAPLDAIVWNGTSGSWLGAEHDRRTIDAIRAATGLPATTATLALLATFRRHGWTRVALAVPYTADVTEQIVRAYASEGIAVVHHADLGLDDTVAMGDLTRADIAGLVARAAHPDAACIAVVCTNVGAAPLVAELEPEVDCPIVDSVAVTFLEGCRLAGRAPRFAGWGRVCAENRLS
jgi:maleate isomerase